MTASASVIRCSYTQALERELRSSSRTLRTLDDSSLPRKLCSNLLPRSSFSRSHWLFDCHHFTLPRLCWAGAEACGSDKECRGSVGRPPEGEKSLPIPRGKPIFSVSFLKVKLRFSAFRCLMAWSAVLWQSFADRPWSTQHGSGLAPMPCVRKSKQACSLVHCMGSIACFVCGVRTERASNCWCRGGVKQRPSASWRSVGFGLLTLSVILRGTALSPCTFSGRTLNSCACKAVGCSCRLNPVTCCAGCAAGRALQGFRAAKQRAIGLEHVQTL